MMCYIAVQIYECKDAQKELITIKQMKKLLYAASLILQEGPLFFN